MVLTKINLFHQLKRGNSFKKSERKESEAIKNVKWHHSLGFKLIFSFFILIVFVIIVGVLSYNKASSVIIDNYNDSCLQAVNMTGEYIGFGMDTVATTATEYTLVNKIQNYFRGTYLSDSVDTYKMKTEIGETVMAKQVSDRLIQNIHIMSSDVNESISTTGVNTSGLYQDFKTSDAAGMLGENKSCWIGSDEKFDKKLSLNSEEYALRHIRSFNNGNAVVMIDVSASSLMNILKRLDFDKNSLVGMVTNDGRQLINTNNKNLSSLKLRQSDFYKTAVKSKDGEGSQIVSYQGVEYLYLYSKVGKTGVLICALIPKAAILQKLNSIRNLTIIMVVIAATLAIIIGTKMAASIQGVIRYLIRQLSVISKGNLAVKLEIKRKDEFSVLAYGIDETIKNMRELIEKVVKESASVTNSSIRVTESSEIFSKVSKGITVSINDIETGVNQQAQDSEDCLEHMDDLSQKIMLVTGETNEISMIAKETKNSIGQGIETMQILNDKTKSTTDITTQIITNIETLEDKSKSISKIVETINSIATETNLLSLNASIEAARAGESGRGFTVVAAQIRNLADQSVGAVHEIEQLIHEIQNETKEAVTTAGKAEEVIKEQGMAVLDTERSFHNMNQHVEALIENVDMILKGITEMDAARSDTLSAIESISAVSQQTAAATISVSEATEHQQDAITTLTVLSKELSENAEALEKAVEMFSFI